TLPFPPARMASLMRRALFLAEGNLGATSPNPSVGTVIADRATGEIIASAATAPGGRPHAEALALSQAGVRARGAILFTTLEPCSHFGLTPPCVRAIVDAGIAMTVYGCSDPDPRVAGQGLAFLEANGVRTVKGEFLKEAEWINLGHSLRMTEDRPFVQLKLAVDANGRVPIGNGKPVWVTDEAARAQAHLLRSRADAILVGRKTIEADDPELTCRLPGIEHRSPLRIVLAQQCGLPAKARIFNTGNSPVWIVCGGRSDTSGLERMPGVRLLRIDASTGKAFDLRHVLKLLSGEGISRLLVEGGPATAREFIEAGLADEVIIMQGETRLGAAATLSPFVDRGLELVSGSKSFILAAQRKGGSTNIFVFRSVAHWQA
ncbi:MAG: bifunctional diaminohydroxyphosphoribosylaminopyrimidine deaminase/5-amino-6-(5-phosphoribosylamino)uracil reductase RibD, partial [Rhodomicrobium sp.]